MRLADFLNWFFGYKPPEWTPKGNHYETSDCLTPEQLKKIEETVVPGAYLFSEYDSAHSHWIPLVDPPPKEPNRTCKSCGANDYEYSNGLWKCSYCGTKDTEDNKHEISHTLVDFDLKSPKFTKVYKNFTGIVK